MISVLVSFALVSRLLLCNCGTFMSDIVIRCTCLNYQMDINISFYRVVFCRLGPFLRLFFFFNLFSFPQDFRISEKWLVLCDD